MLHPVVSLNDPLLDPYRSLKETNHTRWVGQFVVEGDKLARRLLASDFEVESVLVSERYQTEFAALTPPQTPLLVIADDLVERLVGFNFHTGVLACGRRKANPDLQTLVGAGPRLFVICPEVQNPENLGGLIRTAAALGATALWTGPHSADPFSRRVCRVSMGANLSLPVVVAQDLAADLLTLERMGVELIATVIDPAAESLSSFRPALHTAILLGSEGHGLDAQWLSHCRRCVSILMSGSVDSLNVTVAAGIVLHYLSQSHT
jgi:tRNA G18 (ribose-2'-O)-methylase SpoU